MDFSRLAIPEFPVAASPSSGAGPMSAAVNQPVPDSQDSVFSFGAGVTQLQQDMQRCSISSAIDGNAPPTSAHVSDNTSVDNADASASDVLMSGANMDLPSHVRRTRRVVCPWCTFSSTTIGGLMNHITRTHAGESLDESSVVYLSSLERAMCPDCLSIRAVRGSACPRCRSSSVPRQLCVGDIVASVVQSLVTVGEDRDNGTEAV